MCTQLLILSVLQCLKIVTSPDENWKPADPIAARTYYNNKTPQLQTVSVQPTSPPPQYTEHPQYTQEQQPLYKSDNA